MRAILFRYYEHLKLCIVFFVFHVLIIFYIYQTIHSRPDKFSTLYPLNFANVSSITVKIRQLQVFSLMRILVVNVYM